MKRKLPHHSDMVETEITIGSVALILFDLAADLVGPFGDAKEKGDALCEWRVDEGTGITSCEGEAASDDPRVAILVRAGNLLQTGKLPKARRRR